MILSWSQVSSEKSTNNGTISNAESLQRFGGPHSRVRLAHIQIFSNVSLSDWGVYFMSEAEPGNDNGCKEGYVQIICHLPFNVLIKRDEF